MRLPALVEAPGIPSGAKPRHCFRPVGAAEAAPFQSDRPGGGWGADGVAEFCGQCVWFAAVGGIERDGCCAGAGGEAFGADAEF